MQRDVAEQLMKKILEFSQSINSATVIVKQIADEEEQRKLMFSLGDVLGRIYSDLMQPIVDQYPHLDPDK